MFLDPRPPPVALSQLGGGMVKNMIFTYFKELKEIDTLHCLAILMSEIGKISRKCADKIIILCMFMPSVPHPTIQDQIGENFTR